MGALHTPASTLSDGADTEFLKANLCPFSVLQHSASRTPLHIAFKNTPLIHHVQKTLLSSSASRELALKYPLSFSLSFLPVGTE